MAADWALSPQAAVARQRELASQVVQCDEVGEPRWVAGIDVGFPQRGRVTRAAAVLMCVDTLETVACATVELPTRFPYVPGLLSFREAPAMLQALAQLPHAPDLLLCDGHGVAHPRRFGSACHVGVIMAIPCIGVGKSRLVGDDEAPGPMRGDRSVLRHRDEVIGVALRTRSGVKPVYVSVGHRVSLAGAVDWVLRLAPRFRLPEPIRRADRLASNRAAGGVAEGG